MRNHPLYSTDELVIQLRSGSQEAFAQLYSLYSERLYINILALVKDQNTAEELLQDIFVRIWQRRESIYAEQRFDGYLFRISYNRVIDYFRQVKREKELYSRLQEAATRYYSPVEDSLLKRENEELLQKAIASLSPQRRMAFQLCKQQGLSYQQASERMGISLSTIKNHMAMARQSIHDFILANKEAALLLLLIVGQPIEF